MGVNAFVFAIVILLYRVSCNNVASVPRHVGIVGGHSITIEGAPYMASLRLNGTYHWCGASIINENHVLTAAHCIVPYRSYKILVGTSDLEVGGELYDVEKITIHEKFTEATADYDACILKLDRSIKFGAKTSSIELAEQGLKIKTGASLEITGWGRIAENGPMSTGLRQANVPLVGQKSCQRSYFKLLQLITNRMLCAGDGSHDTCQGDSGGPLTYQGRLVGIASFGVGCAEPDTPGVYTRITAIRDWINETISL